MEEAKKKTSVERDGGKPSAARAEHRTCKPEGTRTARGGYRFAQCLKGDFEHPQGRMESLVFDMLFVLGMAGAMVLVVNFGIRPLVAGAVAPAGERLMASLRMLPGLCAVALAIRVAYADRLSNWMMRRFIAPRFGGLAATFLVVVANVVIMSPPMCACAVLLAGAPPAAILQSFRTVYPYAALAGFVLAMVCVRPLVMLLFSNVIAPLHRRAIACHSADR